MLDAFIIEEIRKREEQARRRVRPHVESPSAIPYERPDRDEYDEAPQDDEESDNGVIIIDM